MSPEILSAYRRWIRARTGWIYRRNKYTNPQNGDRLVGMYRAAQAYHELRELLDSERVGILEVRGMA